MKMGLLGILFVIFLVLKLVGVIDWNWIIVFLPLIVDIVIGVITYAVTITKTKNVFKDIEEELFKE